MPVLLGLPVRAFEVGPAGKVRAKARGGLFRFAVEVRGHQPAKRPRELYGKKVLRFVRDSLARCRRLQREAQCRSQPFPLLSQRLERLPVDDGAAPVPQSPVPPHARLACEYPALAQQRLPCPSAKSPFPMSVSENPS